MGWVYRNRGAPYVGVTTGQTRSVASFSTVSLMLEDPDIVARFVDYYHRLGAEEIIIFFDGPVAPLADST